MLIVHSMRMHMPDGRAVIFRRDGKSLWNSSLELGYDHISGGVWYGRSSNHQYDECQYNFAFSQETEGYSFYAGYTHLVFAKDGSLCVDFMRKLGKVGYCLNIG